MLNLWKLVFKSSSDEIIDVLRHSTESDVQKKADRALISKMTFAVAQGMVEFANYLKYNAIVYLSVALLGGLLHLFMLKFFGVNTVGFFNKYSPFHNFLIGALLWCIPAKLLDSYIINFFLEPEASKEPDYNLYTDFFTFLQPAVIEHGGIWYDAVGVQKHLYNMTGRSYHELEVDAFLAKEVTAFKELKEGVRVYLLEISDNLAKEGLDIQPEIAQENTADNEKN